jgi:hypothetical protein
MYLTDRKNNVHRQLSDHEELELLLETFSKQVEELVNEAENIHVCGNLLPLSVRTRSRTCRAKGKCPIDPRDSRAYSRLEQERIAGT